jgi:hypothetical protein
MVPCSGSTPDVADDAGALRMGQIKRAGQTAPGKTDGSEAENEKAPNGRFSKWSFVLKVFFRRLFASASKTT